MKLAALAFLFILALALLAGCHTPDERLRVQLEERYYEAMWCQGEPVAFPGDAQRAAAYAKRVHLVCAPEVP